DLQATDGGHLPQGPSHVCDERPIIRMMHTLDVGGWNAPCVPHAGTDTNSVVMVRDHIAESKKEKCVVSPSHSSGDAITSGKLRTRFGDISKSRHIDVIRGDIIRVAGRPTRLLPIFERQSLRYRATGGDHYMIHEEPAQQAGRITESVGVRSAGRVQKYSDRLDCGCAQNNDAAFGLDRLLRNAIHKTDALRLGARTVHSNIS